MAVSVNHFFDKVEIYLPDSSHTLCLSSTISNIGIPQSIVLGAVSKVSVDGNIKLSIHRADRVFPSIPWRPRGFYDDTSERTKLKLRRIKYGNRIPRSFFVLFFGSYRTRFRYRGPTL